MDLGPRPIIQESSESDNESEPDVLVLDTDNDFSEIEDPCKPTVNRNNIASVWRDIVVGEQMEGCLTRLEVTTNTGYADIDDPNHSCRNPCYSQMNYSQKRKRDQNQETIKKTENITDANCDLDLHSVVKKICTNSDNSDTNKSKSKKKKKKKKKKNNSNNQTLNHLPNIINLEEKLLIELSNDLCTNLCEYNKDLMLSVISKLDRKIILEKYNKTRLIVANGGEMTKNGDRKRTPGGVFFNLIKQDKSIPNKAKIDLYGFSQNKTLKNKIKQEKRKRKKEELKKIISRDKKEAEKLKKLTEEPVTQPSVCMMENIELFD
ncbi:Phosphorylated adapter RNA export protein, RNA-binding domain [Cinara cedri]|uniref:Phosphorylated adapter RNA export protein n=1 Tax=Cinara cedri TaxID=506608 RepID=A0A5E4MKH3_9HEMI|nr:Phosphorylated adapter RNA export protein, RNA-binding domain [Cinara cedri]